MNAANLLAILLNPRKGWRKIKQYPVSLASSMFMVLLPSVLLGSIFSFIGTKLDKEEIELAFGFALYTFIKWLFGIIISSWTINKLVGAFKGEKEIKQTFALVSFSVSFFVVFSSLSHLFPSLRFILSLIGAFSLIYFYFGVITLIHIPQERVAGFLLTSLLIFALIISVLEVLFAIILNLPIQF